MEFKSKNERVFVFNKNEIQDPRKNFLYFECAVHLAKEYREKKIQQNEIQIIYERLLRHHNASLLENPIVANIINPTHRPNTDLPENVKNFLMTIPEENIIYFQDDYFFFQELMNILMKIDLMTQTGYRILRILFQKLKNKTIYFYPCFTREENLEFKYQFICWPGTVYDEGGIYSLANKTMLICAPITISITDQNYGDTSYTIKKSTVETKICPSRFEEQNLYRWYILARIYTGFDIVNATATNTYRYLFSSYTNYEYSPNGYRDFLDDLNYNIEAKYVYITYLDRCSLNYFKNAEAVIFRVYLSKNTAGKYLPLKEVVDVCPKLKILAWDNLFDPNYINAMRPWDVVPTFYCWKNPSINHNLTCKYIKEVQELGCTIKLFSDSDVLQLHTITFLL